jgi:hypothetical protein
MPPRRAGAHQPHPGAPALLPPPPSFSSMELQVLLNHFSAHTDCGDDKLCRETFFSSLSQGERGADCVRLCQVAAGSGRTPAACGARRRASSGAKVLACRSGCGRRPRPRGQAVAGAGPGAVCTPHPSLTRRPRRRRARRARAAFGGLEPRLLQHIYTAMDENGRGWVSFRQVRSTVGGRTVRGDAAGAPAPVRPQAPRPAHTPGSPANLTPRRRTHTRTPVCVRAEHGIPRRQGRRAGLLVPNVRHRQVRREGGTWRAGWWG